MSKLLVEELKTSLSEGFILSNTQRYQIAAILPHLYIHNEPSGNFTFTLKKGANTIFSKTFNVTQIKSTIENALDFSHLWLPIIPDLPTQVESGEYLFELTASGYTFNESAYIGWCRNFEEMSFKGDFGQFNSDENNLQLRLKTKEIP
jgi:hypothetical protein